MNVDTHASGASTTYPVLPDPGSSSGIRIGLDPTAKEWGAHRERAAASIDAAILLADAGLAEHRAALALSEARLSRLQAAAALHRAGRDAEADRIVREVRAEQEADR